MVYQILNGTNMTPEDIVEPIVVRLTRAIHPEDLGDKTSSLEGLLRAGLLSAYFEGKNS